MFVPLLSTEGARGDRGYQDNRLKQREMRHEGDDRGAGKESFQTNKSTTDATPIRELSHSGHTRRASTYAPNETHQPTSCRPAMSLPVVNIDVDYESEKGLYFFYICHISSNIFLRQNKGLFVEFCRDCQW